MQVFDEMLDGAEPALSADERKALIRALMQRGMAKEPQATLTFFVAMVAVNVLLPVLIFVLLVYFRPAYLYVYVLAATLPGLGVLFIASRRVALRHRRELASMMRQRGIRPGRCPRCEYELRGLPTDHDAACPECGEPIGINAPSRTPDSPPAYPSV